MNIEVSDNNWKYQLSLKVGGNMINARFADEDGVAKFTGLKVFNGEILMDYLLKLDKHGTVIPPAPIAAPVKDEIPFSGPFPGAQEDVECRHYSTQTKTGRSAKGPWEMHICNDCGWVAFMDKQTKRLGQWMPPRDKK